MGTKGKLEEHWKILQWKTTVIWVYDVKGHSEDPGLSPHSNMVLTKWLRIIPTQASLPHRVIIVEIKLQKKTHPF